MNKILAARPEDLNDFTGTVLERWLASVAFHGIKTGDYSRLNPFCDRLLGKVPEKIEVTELEQLSDEEILKLGLEAVENLKKKINKED
jgi:hypothetical protein